MKKIVFTNINIIFLCIFIPFLTIAAELDIYKPYGSCVDKAGNLYTANPFKSQVHKFDPDGNLLWTYGVYGSSDGQFRTPQGIAIDSAGSIYIADTGNHRIARITQNANIPVWDSLILGRGTLFLPRDIFIDQNDNLFIIDGSNRVLKFDLNGNPIFSFLGSSSNTFGTIGSDQGRFKNPYGIFIDKTGNIYVADTGNNRIQKFSFGGTFLLSFGSEGNGPNNFLQPLDVVVTSENHILVADSLNLRIQEFDDSGTFLSSSDNDPKWGSKALSVQTLSIESNGTLFAPSNSLSISDSNPVIVETDITPPEILITEVKNDINYNHAVSPVIKINESNPEITSITLNGLPYISGNRITTEGKYTLSVYSKDRIGNESSSSISFVIDLTPPIIKLIGVSNNEKYYADVTMKFTVFDNLDTEPLIISNHPSDTIFNASGKYSIKISAKDKSGNSSFASAKFEICKLNDIKTNILASNIHQALKNSLLSKLSKIQSSLGKNKYAKAIKILNDFIDEIKNKKGREIPRAIANEWITFANNMISLISNSMGNLSLGELFINAGHPELSTYNSHTYNAFFERIYKSSIKSIIVNVYVPLGNQSGKFFIEKTTPFSGSGDVIFDDASSFNLNAIIQKAKNKNIDVLAEVSCFKTEQGEALNPAVISHQNHIKSVIAYLMENYQDLDGIVLTDCSYSSSLPAGSAGVEVLAKFISEVKTIMANYDGNLLGAFLESSDNNIDYQNNVNIFGADYFKFSSSLNIIYVKTFQNMDNNSDSIPDHLPSWVGDSVSYLSMQLNPQKTTCLVPLIQTFDVFEPYNDLNSNGSYDEGEPYADMNNNGIYDIYITTTAEDISTVLSGIQIKNIAKKRNQNDRNMSMTISNYINNFKPDVKNKRIGIGIYDDAHTEKNEWRIILRSHID